MLIKFFQIRQPVSSIVHIYVATHNSGMRSPSSYLIICTSACSPHAAVSGKQFICTRDAIPTIPTFLSRPHKLMAIAGVGWGGIPWNRGPKLTSAPPLVMRWMSSCGRMLTGRGKLNCLGWRNKRDLVPIVSAQTPYGFLMSCGTVVTNQETILTTPY